MNGNQDERLIALGKVVAMHLAFESGSREVRELADRLLADDRAARRAGRLIGFALAAYAGRPGD